MRGDLLFGVPAHLFQIGVGAAGGMDTLLFDDVARDALDFTLVNGHDPVAVLPLERVLLAPFAVVSERALLTCLTNAVNETTGGRLTSR